MSHGSATAEHYLFQIDVRHVLLKKTGVIEKGALFATFVERGKHSASTQDKEGLATANGDFTIVFNEKLSLEATLYRNAIGEFQEKKGKLSLKKKKKGFLSGGHTVVGSIELNFHLLALENESLVKTQLLEGCSFPGSQIQYIVRFRSMSEVQCTNITCRLISL
jgi:hypothetical protein